ncbi:MAG TPA: DsbA family oxidoreductase [Metalysinibacillus jejuensis]|uniref:DsbA family oxidoreductase n=1 Tax=Metalysinibacillus jejuensis TaxID=914327 RepID=A0A921T4T2_9BACL|nr:DsbA family oxidoreductase [Metalysinibacillus jejuensis]
MKIEVWSDYVCPFCYIGKKQLEDAIRAKNLEDDVEVVFKSYMLDPTTPTDSEVAVVDSLSRKYQVTPDKAQGMIDGIVARANEVGLAYDFSELKEENTLKAHRLVKFAETKGKANELNELLLNRHFVGGQRIGQDEVLVTLAKEVGLDEVEVKALLASNDFADAVQADIAESRELGVQGVPFFVINRKYGISGAQPKEVFEQALQQVAEEEGIKPGLKMQGNSSAGVCTDDGCNL